MHPGVPRERRGQICLLLALYRCVNRLIFDMHPGVPRERRGQIWLLLALYRCVNRLMFGMRPGVPRERRGRIWLLLVEQHRLRHKVDEWSATEVEGSEKYDDLLKRLTLHQHAILIDLGM